MKKNLKKTLLLNITQKSINKKYNILLNKTIINYCCGPTVYNHIHLGNLRNIIFSKLFLNFISIFFKKKIISIQNFTDIDEKIIKKSQEKKIHFKKLTKKYIKECIKIMKIFNIYKIKNVISYYPKTTKHIKIIKNIIEKLLLFKKAYIKKDGIYLSLKNINFILSNRQITTSQNDFCLWKFRNKGTRWLFKNQYGIPGWHIECFAMCLKILKKYNENKINFYFGGKDLIFPHHENANILFNLLKNKINVKYWIHNGMLKIDNTKMSKSKNNTLLVKDLLKKYSNNSIKLFLLSSSYYKDLSFSFKEIDNYDNIINNIKNYYKKNKNKNITKIYKNNIYLNKIFNFLLNNFNIQGCVGYIIKNIKNKNNNQDFLTSIFFFFNKILLMKNF